MITRTITYDPLENDNSNERLTLFWKSPLYELKSLYAYICLFGLLLILTIIGGAFICDSLWEGIGNSTNKTLQGAILSITILYIIIDIILLFSFVYYCYRCYRLKELMATTTLS